MIRIWEKHFLTPLLSIQFENQLVISSVLPFEVSSSTRRKIFCHFLTTSHLSLRKPLPQNSVVSSLLRGWSWRSFPSHHSLLVFLYSETATPRKDMVESRGTVFHCISDLYSSHSENIKHRERNRKNILICGYKIYILLYI